MVNGFISSWINLENHSWSAQVLRVAAYAGLVGVLMVGGGRTVVAGPPDKVVRAGGGSPIEIQIDKYGFEWCVVGDINNPPFPGNRQTGAFKGAGVVPYRYRITRTEIPIGAITEFLEAYAPFYDRDVRSAEYTGILILAGWDGDHWIFSGGNGMDGVPAPLSPEQAARFCNWLHNGKVNEEWAFLTGAYDATTFTRNEDGSYNDDFTVLPGARYWIPNMDEYLKAVYYDPNRWGPSRGGWWNYPNASEVPLVPGLPFISLEAGDGAETNAGLEPQGYRGPIWTSGAFPWVQSPWGLLDASGGTQEMGLPFAWGSSFWSANDNHVAFQDSAGERGSNVLDTPNAGSGDYGFRLVSSAFMRVNGR